MTGDLDLICDGFGSLVGSALFLLGGTSAAETAGARMLLIAHSGPVHWSPGLEPALDRVMVEDSLLTRVLAALVGVPGHHRGTTAKDVARAVEIIDAEIARRESEAA